MVLTINTQISSDIIKSSIHDTPIKVSEEIFFEKDKINAIQILQSAIRTNLTLVESRRESAPYLFRSLKESTKPIDSGYGEYIAFRITSSGESPYIDQETYEQIYPILQTPPQENRYKIIREKIKKIAPSLDIAFIPRTLYELVFIRAGIEEEMQTGINCLLFCPELRKNFELSLKDPKDENHSKALSRLENCWHLSHFSDDNLPDPNHPFVKLLARRLNNLLVEKFSIKSCLLEKEVAERTEQELVFFKKHFREFSLEKFNGPLPLRGPFINFGMATKTSSTRVLCSPMVVSAKTSEILCNSIGLECSHLASDKIILSRGGNIENDLIITDEEIHRKSLSYGKSLLSGGLHDGTATVLHYGTDKAATLYQDGEQGRPIYGIIISPEDYQGSDSVYRIPSSTSAICDLSSEGEFFHPRSRIIDVLDTDNVLGVFGSIGQRPQDLTFTLDPRDFYSKLNKKHVKLILLSSR